MGGTETIDEATSRSDLVHEQVRESPIARWILLDGNRYWLAVGFSIGVFLVCAGVGVAGYLPVTDPGTATGLVGSIVGGTLPFITIVLAINQLVLSQELGWTGDLQERFEAMTAFRRMVEEQTDVRVSPAAPAEFLQLLVDAVVDRATAIRPAVDRIDDPTRTALVEDLIDSIDEDGEAVSDALADAEFGTFDALSSVLGHFNGAHLYVARTVLADDEGLPEDAEEPLVALIELLGQLAIARQTFKTLYMQHELAHLSKVLLYVGFPTLLGGGIFMMSYTRLVATIGDPTLLVLLVSAVVTLVFLPFVVLLVYTFRIATIASRTADFGPFVPRVDVGS